MMNLKIAIATDDGVSVSQHFGRAPYYLVYTIEDGKITGREKRNKASHHHQVNQGPHGCHGSAPHGFDASAERKHEGMISNIRDCQVLVAGGMGMGAYNSLKSYNIIPVVTDIAGAEEAARLYIGGKLTNLMERLH